MDGDDKRNGVFDQVYIKKLWKHLSERRWFSWAGQETDHHQFGGFRGTGNNFRESVKSLDEKCEKSISAPTAGNGASMKVWPCAVVFCGMREVNKNEGMGFLMESVLAVASITHSDINGITPAYAFAYMTYIWMR